ncbi:MAG: phosphate transport system regulatory protein PhoU [Rhodobacteraceae bacterium]|nr:phosphate transport system regulatory protein PhoU [Paracoccaceae bacterium]
MNSSQHIRSAFDRDLDMIQAKMLKMGGLVEAAILDAAKSFESRDLELAQEVRARDKKIDALEAQINEDVTRIIALRAPAASDLRTLLSILKVAGNLERIGDYAKNMAKRTNVLLQLPLIENSPASLRRLAREVQIMLKDALDAYTQRDAEMGMDIISRDRDIDELYNALFREFLTYMMEDPRNITPSMHLHFIAKNIERMGDHVTSIAEQVVFVVTGELPGEPRDKGDVTSTDLDLSQG